MINVPNTDDNDCFKWWLVRYLNAADHHPATIRKDDKNFAKTLNFKDIGFPVKIRDIQKIENKNSIAISVFGYENEEKYPTCISTKCCKEKHLALLMIG